MSCYFYTQKRNHEMEKTKERVSVSSSENWIKYLCRDKENSSHIMSEQVLDAIASQFEDYARDCGDSGSCSYMMIKAFASDVGMSHIKVRKILITQGMYINDKSLLIGKLYREGKTIEEMQEITGLKRATVYSYLPYCSVKDFPYSTFKSSNAANTAEG